MTTLFKHKKTGARVKIISELDNGDCFMVEDQDSRTFYAYKHELESDPEGTKKVKTLQIKYFHHPLTDLLTHIICCHLSQMAQ